MQSQPHMEYAPEEPEPPRQKRKSMAGEAADAYRKAAKPGITRQTAERRLKTHDSLLQFQVASGKGEMELSGQRRTLTIRRFSDLSMMAQEDGKPPFVVRRVHEQQEALEILEAAGRKRK